MLIWDIIRDWFVMNVWGGFTSDGNSFPGYIGMFYSNNNYSDAGFTTGLYLPINGYLEGDSGSIQGVVGYICLGDWLSTTSTILVLIAVCIALYCLVRYFFRMFAGLLSGR